MEFRLESYFFHPDGDPMALKPEQQAILNDVISFEPVKGNYESVVGLKCKVKSGRSLYIRLYNQDREGTLISNLDFKWL